MLEVVSAVSPVSTKFRCIPSIASAALLRFMNVHCPRISFYSRNHPTATRPFRYFGTLSCCFFSFLALFWQKKRSVSSWKRFLKKSKKRRSIWISDDFWVKNGQKMSEIFTLVRGFSFVKNPLTSVKISDIFWPFLTQKSPEIPILYRFFEFFKNRFHEDTKRFFCQKSTKNEKKQQERPRKYRKGRITVGWFLL